MKDCRHSWSHLAQFSLQWEMFQTKVVEKIKTHILCSVTFFSPENRAVYEVMSKNTVEPGRPQMAIWRMCIACWIPKATNTHSVYVILIDFLQWFTKAAQYYVTCILLSFCGHQVLHILNSLTAYSAIERTQKDCWTITTFSIPLQLSVKQPSRWNLNLSQNPHIFRI